MTTKSDWEFRANYLRAAADGMDERAQELIAEAHRYRILADRVAMRAGLPSATQVAAGGFFTNLTPEQQAAALAEREDDL